MKFIIDSADLQAIKKICEIYPIDGVTTNPSILSSTKKSPFNLLAQIREIIGENRELHVQVISETAEQMLKEAHEIQRVLGTNTYIKIPTCEQGLLAIKMLKKENAFITATAIFTQMQALLAAKAGAHYVAPYINRICNTGKDGAAVAIEIHDAFKNSNIQTQVLGAGFKNTMQIQSLCMHGIGAVTVFPDLMEGLVGESTVQTAISTFKNDFENAYGENKIMQENLFN